MRRPAGRSAVVVLVVDDEDDVREVTAEAFRTLGFDAFEARNGVEALQVLTSHPEIVLLFSDVRMPGMSGTELARTAMRTRPGLTVVLTSAWPGETPLPDGTPIVPKPWSLGKLAALVEALIGAGTQMKERK